jgi:hypothetical protein
MVVTLVGVKVEVAKDANVWGKLGPTDFAAV